jgi:antitoxin VapB
LLGVFGWQAIAAWYIIKSISAYDSEDIVPLYVKDAEVDRLVERLASLRRTSKTEVVREALRHELEREEAKPSLVDKGVAFVRALKARAQPSLAQTADKAFLDDLYGDP